jgi:hypothetical protein
VSTACEARLSGAVAARSDTRAQTVAAISAVGRFSSAGGVADLQAAIAAGVAAYRAGAVTR